MTNAELLAKIKAEIEKQMKFYDEKEMKAWDDSEQRDEDALWYQGHRKMCAKLLSFLSTLESENPVPNGLEEVAMEMYPPGINDNLRFAFIAGAKWDRERLMKEAVEGTVYPLDQEIWCDLDKFPELKDGDKVRIIICKKEE